MRGGREIRWILWDNDGVLVDTEGLYYRATRDVLAGAGVELTEAMFVDLFLVQSRGAWHLVAERGAAAAEIEELRRRRSALYAELLESSAVILPGVRETLERLSRRVRMGVVTSSRRDHFEIIHRSTGLLGFFEFCVTADDCGRLKPAPEPYLRAVELAGASVGECLAVEDSMRGLAAARAAGIACWVIPSRFMPGCEFPGAERILGSIADVEV
jgi:HAD superfamily hydrolase (TIGR01509 family)